MNDAMDLSDVDPLKWAEVRKRVEVVQRYLAIPHPTGADRDRHAAELGLRTGQFYNLIRAWREHRHPSALAVGVRRIAGPSRSRRGGVDPRARQIARDAIAELGRDAPIALLEAKTIDWCTIAGVAPPSRGTIRLLAKEGGSPQPDVPAAGIFVARTFVQLPTKIADFVELPATALVAEHPNGRILEFTLADYEDARARIGSAVAKRLCKNSLPVIATDADADLLEEALPLVCTRETNPGIALLLASTVGKRVGHVELRSRRPTLGAQSVMQSVHDVPLSSDDAQRALHMAMANHNRAIAGSARLDRA